MEQQKAHAGHIWNKGTKVWVPEICSYGCSICRTDKYKEEQPPTQRKRVFLDDLEEVVKADSAENDGATWPEDLSSWMEEDGGAAETELFQTGHIEIRLAGRTFHLSLVIEEEV